MKTLFSIDSECSLSRYLERALAVNDLKNSPGFNLRELSFDRHSLASSLMRKSNVTRYVIRDTISGEQITVFLSYRDAFFLKQMHDIIVPLYKPITRELFDSFPKGALVYFKIHPVSAMEQYETISTNILFRSKTKKGNQPRDKDTVTDFSPFTVRFELLPYLKIRHSLSCRGRGLITLKRIPCNECLGEYTGKICNEKQCYFSNYRIKLENGNYVDARHYGNKLRFINSSCQPNAMYYQLAIDGALHMFVVTTRQIEPYEEIFCRYYSDDKLLCDCQSPTCYNPFVTDDSLCDFEPRKLPNQFLPNYYYV
jgi:hypothetical protein